MATEMTLAPLRALSEREERFAQHLAVFDDPAAAYLASGETTSTDRAIVRRMAYTIKARPHVGARIVALRNELAAAGPKATQDALVQQLQESLAVDVAEIVRLHVVHCPACYGPAYDARYAMLVAVAIDEGRTEMPAAPLSVGEFDPDREPWANCAQCLGAGRNVVKMTSTDKLSAPARRLIRGYETHSSDGSVKKLLLADQTQLRQELHRTVPGFYAPDRSVTLNVHADVKPLKRNMSLEEALDVFEQISPTNAALPAPDNVVSEQ